MRGKWRAWYEGHGVEPEPYADTASYQAGAFWLHKCAMIEDWGCGLGWLRTLVPEGRYRGIDGTASPFADEVADLREYRSITPGLFMRHVLEHNDEWEVVLDNALASYTERFALILFTPLSDGGTKRVGYVEELGVPTLSLDRDTLHEKLWGADPSYLQHTINSSADFGQETIFCLGRS